MSNTKEKPQLSNKRQVKINEPISREDLESCQVWGWDIENTSKVKPGRSDYRIISASLACRNTVYGFLLDHKLDLDTGDNEYNDRISWINEILEDSGKIVCGHNVVAHDVTNWCVHLDVMPQCKFFDTLVANSLINENAFGNNSLQFLAEDLLGEGKVEGIDTRFLDKYDPMQVLQYNMKDAELSYRLYSIFKHKLTKESVSSHFEVMMELGKVLLKWTVRGIRGDLDEAQNRQYELLNQIEAVEHGLNEMLSEKFEEGVTLNINSPKQMRQLFLDCYEVPIIKLTPKNLPCFDSSVLTRMKIGKAEDIQGRHVVFNEEIRNLARVILDLRKKKKYESTFLRPFTDGRLLDDDHRVRTTFHLGKGQFEDGVGGTVTGRLSSSKPNLQNQPRGPLIRNLFIPDKKFSLFNADYSQLEMRIAGWYSKDPKMLEAFAKGLDLHTYTMSKINGLDYEECVARLNAGDKELKEKRVINKTINFLILYRGGWQPMVESASKMGISLTKREAEKNKEMWESEFSVLISKLNDWERHIRTFGKIRTPIGTIRRLPTAMKGDYRAVRQGVNFMIQNLAAWVMYVAILIMDEEMDNVMADDSSVIVENLLTVHDNVVGQELNFTENLEEFLKDCMVTRTNRFFGEVFGLDPLPLSIDVEKGLSKWQ